MEMGQQNRPYRAKGYELEKEAPIGEGKAIGPVAVKGDRNIAIEIETGKSDVEANVKKCRKAGFGKVVTVYTKRKGS